MKKRLLALLMACSMTLGMAVTAFATTDGVVEGGDDGYSTTTNITGTTQQPTIKVTVPTTGTIVINPYELKYTDADSVEHTDKIISATQWIKSESNVAISVSVNVKATVAGNAKLATGALKGTETTNSVFLYFELVEATDDTTAITTWASEYDKTKTTHVVASAKGTAANNIYTLPATNDTTSETFAAFHMAGDVASAPATAWTSADKVDIVLTFTFAPAVTTTTTTT